MPLFLAISLPSPLLLSSSPQLHSQNFRVCFSPDFLGKRAHRHHHVAYWCERPDYFAAIADAKPGHDRALAVLRWFISTLKDQYTSRNEEMGSEKKSVALVFSIRLTIDQFLDPSTPSLVRLSTASGQLRLPTRPVAQLLCSSSKCPITRPLPPTSSITPPNPCAWQATTRRRPHSRLAPSSSNKSGMQSLPWVPTSPKQSARPT